MYHITNVETYETKTLPSKGPVLPRPPPSLTPLELVERHTVPVDYHLSLVVMLHELRYIFELYKIQYWLDGGSLLGCLRDNKIIPWDDDIDLAIMYTDMNKLRSPEVCKVISSKGMQIDMTDPDCFKVFKLDTIKLLKSGHIIPNATIDIFTYERKGSIEEAIIQLHSPTHRKLFRNCYHKEKELFPLQSSTLNKVEVKIPKNGKPYLTRYYGWDCFENYVIQTRVGVANPSISVPLKRVNPLAKDPNQIKVSVKDVDEARYEKSRKERQDHFLSTVIGCSNRVGTFI